MGYALAVALGFGLALMSYKFFRGISSTDEVTESLRQIQLQQEQILANLDEVLEAVSEFSTIGDSLDAVFAQLQTLISQGAQDPAKLQQALDMVSTSKERTKAAIVANTPSSGEVPPTDGSSSFGR